MSLTRLQSAAIASAIQGLILDLGIEDSNQIASVTKAIANAGPAVQSAVAAALPNEATQNYGAFETAVNNIITGSPTGFGALPTDVQAFVKSVASQEASIFNNGGSTPTSNGAGQQVPCRWDIGVWAGGLVAALVGTILA